MAETNFDVVVIGGGPGGYVAAIRAAQLKLKTAVVEREHLGGICLNWGCIPTKALLRSAEVGHMLRYADAYGFKVDGYSFDLKKIVERSRKVAAQLSGGVKFLLKKNKAEAIIGEGTITAPGKVGVRTKDGVRELSAKHIVIATGSDVAPLPGVTIDEQQIVSSTGALSFAAAPKRLLVVGAGVIGLELGSVWRRLGSEVRVVEFLDRIVPGVDLEIAKAFQRILEKQGMSFKLGAKVVGVEKKAGVLSVAVEPAAGGPRETFEADAMLVAIGRRAYTDGLGLDAAGVKRDARGRVMTDSHFKTNVSGIWAIGDVREGAMLAHKAEDEAVACAEIIAGHAGHVN